MAPTRAQIEEWLETLEQAITARNLDDYRQEYPDWPAGEISYTEWVTTFLGQWRQCVPVTHTEVVVSGSDGRAVVTFADITTPVVSIGQTTSHLVIVETVAEGSVTVRVLDGGSGVPGVNVHVTVTDATPVPAP